MASVLSPLPKWLWSLRARTFLVVCVVTAAPVLFVLCSTLYEELLSYLLMARTESALQDVLSTRTVADDVSVVRVTATKERLFFGPNDDRSALVTRAETKHGKGNACTVSRDGFLHRCASWITSADGTLLYSEASDLRTVRSLLDDRAALLKLTLLVLPASLLMGLWLSRYVVRPLERLRMLVHQRADSPRPSADLPIERPDEIGDVARSFNLLIERLVSRQEANDAFMQDLAHELKSPLAAVRACAERLAEESALDVARAQRLSRVLRDSGQKLELVLKDFLELASAEAGMHGEEQQPVDMSTLVQNLVESARARHEPLTWTVRCEPEILARGVAPRLEAALGHLLDNAAAFAKARVSVTVETDSTHVQIRVEDDGPGIPDEHQAQVFERFFTRRAGRGGTGLGLAVVRAIALAHDGDVSVRSIPGQGASFTLTIPRPTAP